MRTLPRVGETFRLDLGRVVKELFLKFTNLRCSRPENVPASITLILFPSRFIFSSDSCVNYFQPQYFIFSTPLTHHQHVLVQVWNSIIAQVHWLQRKSIKYFVIISNFFNFVAADVDCLDGVVEESHIKPLETVVGNTDILEWGDGRENTIDIL